MDEADNADSVGSKYEDSGVSPEMLAAMIIGDAETRFRESGDLDSVFEHVHGQRLITADSETLPELDRQLIEQLLSLYLESDDDS